MILVLVFLNMAKKMPLSKIDPDNIGSVFFLDIGAFKQEGLGA